MAERRVDPAFPGQSWTYDELRTYYANDFGKKAIKTYWDLECFVQKRSAKAKVKVKAKAKPKEPKPPKSGRFVDAWWRQFDRPTDGYRDSMGFVNRLPLRLESTEVMVHGLVDAKKMWAEYEDESFIPVTVGGKAVVSIWFNNFLDTDCGGAYYETWYNTYVSNKNEPAVDVPAEAGPMGVIANEKSLSFLQRVVCSNTPDNPGAAEKAICGGREIFGFPKHPDPGHITLSHEEADGTKTALKFEAQHAGKLCVKASVRLPEADSDAMKVPLDVKTPNNFNIGAPRLGGTHKGHNGALQSRYGTAVKCTQYVKGWDSKTDTLSFGDDAHYATPIKGWDFTPVLKVNSPDFKIVAFKPSGWISGRVAGAAVRGHEKKIAEGTKAGAL